MLQTLLSINLITAIQKDAKPWSLATKEKEKPKTSEVGVLNLQHNAIVYIYIYIFFLFILFEPNIHKWALKNEHNFFKKMICVLFW